MVPDKSAMPAKQRSGAECPQVLQFACAEAKIEGCLVGSEVRAQFLGTGGPKSIIHPILALVLADRSVVFVARVGHVAEVRKIGPEKASLLGYSMSTWGQILNQTN